MPAVNCPSKDCVESKANGRLHMQVRGSKFNKFQEIRIQELVSKLQRHFTVLFTETRVIPVIYRAIKCRLDQFLARSPSTSMANQQGTVLLEILFAYLVCWSRSWSAGSVREAADLWQRRFWRRTWVALIITIPLIEVRNITHNSGRGEYSRRWWGEGCRRRAYRGRGVPFQIENEVWMKQ